MGALVLSLLETTPECVCGLPWVIFCGVAEHWVGAQVCVWVGCVGGAHRWVLWLLAMVILNWFWGIGYVFLHHFSECVSSWGVYVAMCVGGGC